MSAGTGVFHSEQNPDRKNAVSLLQTWIFPNKRSVKPRYDQTHFDPEARVNKLQMLVSPIEGNDEGLKIHQDAWIYRTTLQAGHSLTHQLHSAGHGAYVFVIDGNLSTEGHQLTKRDAVGISDTESFSLSATADSDVLIFEVPLYLP